MRAVVAGLLVLAGAADAAPRTLIGVHGAWGAFREGDRCFALAAPERRTRPDARWRAFVGVGSFPTLRQEATLFVRLSRARDRSAGVTLSVGERRFRLVANGTDAWAPDPASDRAAVAALRGARSMSVEAVAEGGRPFADTYRLDGAATAIDAAVLACR